MRIVGRARGPGARHLRGEWRGTGTENTADEGIQRFELCLKVQRGRDAPGMVAQPVEFAFAVHPGDLVQIPFDFLPRPALGAGGAGARRLQVLEQGSCPRGDEQPLHEGSVAFHRPLTLEQAKGDAGQGDALGVFISQKQRIVAGDPTLQRRAVAHHGLGVIMAQDAIKMPADDTFRRVDEVRGIELGGDAAQPAGSDIAGNGRGFPGAGAAEDDFVDGRRSLSFFH